MKVVFRVVVLVFVLFQRLGVTANIHPDELLGSSVTEGTIAESCIQENNGCEAEEEAAVYTAEDDVSWAVKHETLKYKYQQQEYKRFMAECRKASPYCKSKEALRLYMNQHQPASVYNYTKMGVAKIKTPPLLWELIYNFYQQNKGQKVIEWGQKVTAYQNTWDVQTEIVRLDNTTLGGGVDLHAQINHAAKDVLEQWTGQKLAPV